MSKNYLGYLVPETPAKKADEIIKPFLLKVAVNFEEDESGKIQEIPLKNLHSLPNAKNIKLMIVGEGGFEYGNINDKYKPAAVLKSVKEQLNEACLNSSKKVSEVRLQVCDQGKWAEKDKVAIKAALQEYGSSKIHFSCPKKFSALDNETGNYIDTERDAPLSIAECKEKLADGSLKGGCTYEETFEFKVVGKSNSGKKSR